MQKRKLLQVIPLIILLLASFIAGVHVQDALAADSFNDWVVALQRLPAELQQIVDRGEVSSQNDLPPLETYVRVLSLLSTDYYGQKVKERELTYNAIRGLLKGLDDPFTRFLAPEDYKKMREENEGNFVGIGAHLDTNKKHQIYIKEPLPNSPAIKAGVKAGDVILKVDDKAIAGMDIDAVVKKIRGNEDTKVKLTLLREKSPKPVEITIVRKVVPFQMVVFRMQDPKDKLGYIRLWQFNEQSDVQMEDAFNALEKQHMKGLVLDLRGNPGGLLQVAVDIGSRFIESGPVVIIQERGGQRSSLDVEETQHRHKRLPLVVLVDGRSASASEIVAGAIKDNKVGTLVGTTTFGKGRVQTIMPLADGSALSITTAKYLTPKGVDIHKVGIKPDIVVEVPETGFDPTDPAKDPQLQKAVEVLKQKMGLAPVKKNQTAGAVLTNR